MLLPRHCTKLSIPLLALPLSCTGNDTGDDEVADDTTSTETGDGDGDGDGDGGPCTAAGTVVPDFEPFGPSAEDPNPTCSTGWASDAPLTDAKWVAMVPSDSPYGYYSGPLPIVKALSGNAALLILGESMQWYDGEGTLGPSVDNGFVNGVAESAVLVREADDHVFIAGPLASDIVIREFVDGTMVSELMVPTPGDDPRVAGLFEFSTDEWLIVGDEFDPVEGNSESFFMRADALGNQLLRKAAPSSYSYYYSSSYVTFAALDLDENLLFGSFSQQWIVDPNDGAVLNASAGIQGSTDVIGSKSGAGFVLSSSAFNMLTFNDGSVSSINAGGVNQWTRTYDRALTSEAFVALAARPGGGYVVSGVDGIWWQPDPYQASNQPMIVAFDEQGTAEWIGRLAIPGATRSVDAAADGGVAAAGTSRTGGTSYNDLDSWLWIASW